MTSYRHGHLLKDPLANTVTLRVRVQYMNFRGHIHSISVTKEDFMSSGPSALLPQL